MGHAWPSGAAQDRRAWVELLAYDEAGTVVFQSGVVADGEVVGAREPSLPILRDRLYDENGSAVQMFWRAAPSDSHPQGNESNLLPATESSPAAKTSSYALPAPAARVTARLRLQSIGLDVLDDFQGIHLPVSERVLNNYYQGPTLRSRVPTITVPGTERELQVSGDGVVSLARPAPSDDCLNQVYVSLLPAD